MGDQGSFTIVSASWPAHAAAGPLPPALAASSRPALTRRAVAVQPLDEQLRETQARRREHMVVLERDALRERSAGVADRPIETRVHRGVLVRRVPRRGDEEKGAALQRS